MKGSNLISKDCLVFSVGLMFLLTAYVDLVEATDLSEQGYEYAEQKSYQEAIETFKKAIEANPYHAETHYGLGWPYYELGLYIEAVHAFKEAIRIEPGHVEVFNKLGVIYSKLGHYQKGIDA